MNDDGIVKWRSRALDYAPIVLRPARQACTTDTCTHSSSKGVNPQSESTSGAGADAECIFGPSRSAALRHKSAMPSPATVLVLSRPRTMPHTSSERGEAHIRTRESEYHDCSEGKFGFYSSSHWYQTERTDTVWTTFNVGEVAACGVSGSSRIQLTRAPTEHVSLLEDGISFSFQKPQSMPAVASIL
jgi:hypothetical protein